MSCQKQNLLWLMIICCSTCQIVCLGGSNQTKVKIQINSTDQCFWNGSSLTNSAIKVTCLSNYNTQKGNVDIMNVSLNISSQEQCKAYSFNITKQGEHYEVRMNEMVEENKIYFLPDECQCSQDLNISGFTVNCRREQINDLPKLICLDKDCTKSPAVDPGVRCRNAKYERSTCKKKRNGYILRLKDKPDRWKCVTCNKSATPCSQGNKTACIKQLETNFSLSEIKKEDGFIDPAKALDALDKMESLVKEMEKSNKLSAAITMGDVIGVLQRQADNTETEDFCYSSDQNVMNILDCQSELDTDFPWSVKIPIEAFDKARLEDNRGAFVGMLRFKNMGNKNETNIYTVLNNETYGITMGAKISNLTDNIEMFFKQTNMVGKASCVSWDGKGELKWTTFGCETEIKSNTIKCSCSHLTSFAVLMSLSDHKSKITAPHQESLTFITSIGCGISMFFLSIALFMHFLLR